MSLFGSGRREGIFAAVALVATALLVHAIGAYAGFGDGYEGDHALASAMATAHRLLGADELPLWDPAGAGAPLWSNGAELFYPPWWLLGRGEDRLWLPVLVAAHAALACALAFRFLRAQGRSRYAAFVAGAAYGLGAHTGSLSGHLAEVAALAWAPLPIEILLRIARSERNRHLAPWLGPALAVPFWTGGTATACCTTALVGVWLLRRAIRERLRRQDLMRTGLGAAASLLLLTGPLLLCAGEAPSSVPPPLPQPDMVLELQRVAGPLLTFLAMLGVLRRQRQAPSSRWLPIAIAGAIVAVTMPLVPSPFRGPAPWHESPAALWWPTHLALVLLAASGLDDFLDLPQRRRAATAALLVLCVVVAPFGLLGLSLHDFRLEAAVVLALTAMFALWRWLGILGFKTVLAAAALVWLAAATLYEQARAVRSPIPVAWLPAGAGAQPSAPSIESQPPLLPARARVSFALRADLGDPQPPVPLPQPPGAPIDLRGLPLTFTARPDPAANVRLLREGSNWAEYAVAMGSGTGALIVSDTYARGWRARVDERQTLVYRADNGYRAVLLQPGNHQVRFDYQPLALRLGPQMVAAGTLLVLAWALATAVRRLRLRTE